MTLEEAICKTQNVGNSAANWPAFFTKWVERKQLYPKKLQSQGIKQDKTNNMWNLDPDLNNLIIRNISETGGIWTQIWNLSILLGVIVALCVYVYTNSYLLEIYIEILTF